MEVLTIRMDGEDYRAVMRGAEVYGCSAGEICRRAIRLGLIGLKVDIFNPLPGVKSRKRGSK